MPFERGKAKTGGRVKGVQTKGSAKREAEIKQGGITPLDYMLSKLRDEQASDDDRKWAAQNAAPYVHPKLATTTLKGDEDAPMIHEIRRTIKR